MDTKFIIAGGFGIFSIVVALVKCLIGHVRFGGLVLQVLLAGIIFAGLGYLIAYLFESQVPQLYDLLRGSSPDVSSDGEEEDMQRDTPHLVDTVDESAEEVIDTEPTQEDIGIGNIDDTTYHPGSTGKVEKIGDSIVIDSKQFPSDPKMLADAVKTKLGEE